MPNRIIENQLFMPGRRLTPEQLRRRLLPGEGNSGLQFGFLDPGEDLEALIRTDVALLEQQGLTHEQVADAIEALFACPSDDEFRGNPIFPRRYIHSPECPWGDFCAVSFMDLAKKVTEIVVPNPNRVEAFYAFCRENGGEIGLNDYPKLVEFDLAMIFSDLHPHMIREHRFLQGHKTPYRVRPERVGHYLCIGR